ncbi:alkaline phosphatase family protein [Microlunatus elymi]|uniref:Alkaline phosphatase family protein n=1 Tax=Microlunatus elymi TaxID=2596828 RepID=A0A516PZD0_9ACTN|nr:nucleotide pyrophosphatase/phosphodiesterase family protein [Microlunatus elymi]QDP96533.1 alkaline phosphatase family protein [Microlunatus elymi]
MIRPSYQRSTLADLLPSIGAQLGVRGCDDILQLPPADRYVVVLVDGLGWHLLRRAVRNAEYLTSLLGDARPITSGVPSTTVTSLTSLGTGLTPGEHGMAGYTSRVPELDKVLNALYWDVPISPERYQPRPTLFDRAAEAGVRVSSVSPAHFAGSGLTRAAQRGAEFVGYPPAADDHERAELVTRAAMQGERSLVYAYERDLDHCGHSRGCESPDWLDVLTQIDRRLGMLRDQLPDEVRMIITGDHGMIDIPRDLRIIAEDESELLVGVDAIAGEARFRQLYVDRDNPHLVAARWADLLGDRAWVRTRGDAIDDGWFGPVDDRVIERFGHVLVAMRDDWAVMTRTQPRESSLIGMHGSLTPAEMTVPLLVD